MERVERLLNLTAALLNAGRPLTSADIRAQVPGYPEGAGAAFKRAFERDKESLREMGIPILLRDVPGREQSEQGYVIPREQYELADPGLTPDELAAVHLATAAVQLEGLRGHEAVWKLGGTPAPAPPPAVAALPTIPQLVPLFGAVAARAPVAFLYRGERRSVDPWRLSFSRGHWYLDGHDHDRGEARQFRLDRVEGDVEVGAPASFERPADFEPGSSRPWQIGHQPPVTAVVRVDADQAGWAVDHVGAEAVTARHDDGSVELSMEVTNRDAFRSFVLGFLDHAEVLAPPELRADLLAWLRRQAS